VPDHHSQNDAGFLQTDRPLFLWEEEQMRFSFLVVLFVPMLACTSVKSTDIKTAGMSAHMKVVADGTGQTEASAQLNVDTSLTDFVDLSSGDSLAATVGGKSQTLARNELLGVITYSTAFTGQDAAGTAYTVALTRATDTNAPSSTCTIPGPFSITTPASNASFSRAKDDIAVAYSNGGTQNTMTWSVSGTCINGAATGTVTADSGTFTITRASITPADSSQASQTCQVTLTLIREGVGQLDPAYGYGGSIVGRQVRSMTFHSTP
jgi:hypothetical protein